MEERYLQDADYGPLSGRGVRRGIRHGLYNRIYKLTAGYQKDRNLSVAVLEVPGVSQ